MSKIRRFIMSKFRSMWKLTFQNLNFNEFCCICNNFLEAKFDENVEAMKRYAEGIQDHTICEATKERVLKSRDLSWYDIEAAIAYKPPTEESDDELATCLADAEEMGRYNSPG